MLLKFKNFIIRSIAAQNLMGKEKEMVERFAMAFIMGVFNFSFGITVLSIMNFDVYFYELLVWYGILWLTIPLTRFTNFYFGIYFYLLSAALFIAQQLYMCGWNSNFLYYFHNTILLGAIFFGRSETIKHFIAIALSIVFICCFMLFVVDIPYYSNNLTALETFGISSFNVVSSLLSSILLLYGIVHSFNFSQHQLESAVEDKKVLLAEVFHRVKNNLSVIRGMINLQAESADNSSVRNALQKSKHRIEAMSMVYKSMYGEEQKFLSGKDYLQNLLDNIHLSHPETEGVIFDSNLIEFEISISTAINFGIIINEILENALEHAKPDDSNLYIQLNCFSGADRDYLEIIDNGKGFEYNENEAKFGLSLVSSLCEDLECRYSFSNNEGCRFEMELPLKHS